MVASVAAADEPAQRLIVGFRAQGDAVVRSASAAGKAQALGVRSGIGFRAQRSLGPRMAVVELPDPQSGEALAVTLARLAADPDVAFVEPDARARPHATPNDPLFTGQWYLQATEASAINAVAAWDTTTGSEEVIVAVLDTGVLSSHPDLGVFGSGGRVLPGRDFVGPDSGGGFRTANDGNGWDADPTDPGDWVTSGEAATSFFAGCLVTNSSWHGTRIAGMIGALTDNATGIAGSAWDGWILPVRVLGKCGGYNSDIIQGMRWAAGLSVDTVPANPFPARIINISLGALGNCTNSYQAAVDEVVEAGAVVVASAGNETGPVDAPANCDGAVAVAGLRATGAKVGYSSLGPEVTLAAPGGNCVNTGGPCLFSLDTTSNAGTTVATTAIYTDQLDANVGTSFSAPLVAATAALMLAVNSNLAPAELRERLQQSARSFPSAASLGLANCPNTVDDTLACACTTSTCGAGMLDAAVSVAAALRPIAIIDAPATVVSGQPVVLDGSDSAPADSRTLTGFAWTVRSGSANLSGANTPVATLDAPAPGASVVLRLTVTDNLGLEDFTDVTVSTPGGGGGGGGGGTLGLAGLVALLIGLARRRR